MGRHISGREATDMAIVTRRDPVGVVAEFLRKVLAKGPESVSDLEAMARTAGLLVEGQSITKTKNFKVAKKALGIKSRRTGFGSSGRWIWFLERKPVDPVGEHAGQFREAPPVA